MPQSQRIVLGTRGSELALAQTRLVEQALRTAFPELNLEVRVIATTGDERNVLPNESFDPRAGRKGVFTKEIEQALRRSEIDVAIHSAKDLPSDTSDDLEISATLPRAAVDDALIMRQAKNFSSLRREATVATGSVRRQHQLRWKRPDLRFAELRGNVPTRLRKLVDSDWDAIVLARAGLERIGYDLSRDTVEFENRSLHVDLLPPDIFLPAGGQGVIAIQVRRGDEILKERVRAINHPPTLFALDAEREFLRLLQADCNSPVGVLGSVESKMMTLQAQVFEPPAAEPRTGNIQFSLQNKEPEDVAAALHAVMYGKR